MTWRVVGWVSLAIATIGAFGWGLVGIFRYAATGPGYSGQGRIPTPISAIEFGGQYGALTTGSRVVYTIVGVAGLIAFGVFVSMAIRRLSAWRAVSSIAVLVTAVGGMSWGLIGLFKYDFLTAVYGNSYGALTTGNRVLYTIIGAAGLVSVGALVSLFREYFIPVSVQRPSLGLVEPVAEERRAA